MEQWNCRLVPTGELYRENESESANTLHVVPIQRWSHCHQHSRQLPVENVSIKFRSTGPEDEAHDFSNFWLQDQIRVRRLGSSVEYWQLNSWDLANCTREWTLCSRGQTFFFFVFQCWAPERNLWTLRRSPKNVAWIFTAVCLLCNNQPWTSNYVRLNWWPISKLQMAIHWTQRVERAITNNCHVGAKRGRCTFHNEPHTVQVNWIISKIWLLNEKLDKLTAGENETNGSRIRPSTGGCASSVSLAGRWLM